MAKSAVGPPSGTSISKGRARRIAVARQAFVKLPQASNSMGKILLKGVEVAQSLGRICFHCLEKRRNHGSKFPIAPRHYSRSFAVQRFRPNARHSI
jgi:hypothetical protein